MNNNGLLTRDGFAVAMHLIQNKLAGKDIPASLPLSLIPPAMRNNVPAAQAAPPKPQIPEAMRDLLWDDTPPASTTTAQASPPTLQPQATGAFSPPQPVSPPLAPHSVFSTANTDPFATSHSPFGSMPGMQFLCQKCVMFLIIHRSSCLSPCPSGPEYSPEPSR